MSCASGVKRQGPHSTTLPSPNLWLRRSRCAVGGLALRPRRSSGEFSIQCTAVLGKVDVCLVLSNSGSVTTDVLSGLALLAVSVPKEAVERESGARWQRKDGLRVGPYDGNGDRAMAIGVRVAEILTGSGLRIETYCGYTRKGTRERSRETW